MGSSMVHLYSNLKNFIYKRIIFILTLERSGRYPLRTFFTAAAEGRAPFLSSTEEVLRFLLEALVVAKETPFSVEPIMTD